MERARLQSITRTCVATAGLIIAVCVAILLADYVVFRILTPQDDKRHLALQEQIKTDATLAPKLAADQKAVTQRRLARRTRGRVIAYVLIGSAALFLACTTWLLGQRGPRPAAMNRPSGKKVREAPAARPSPSEKPAAPSRPPPVDLRFVEEVVARLGRGKEASIPILLAIQARYRSLPYEVLARVCELTDITPAEIESTASLYARFRLPGRQAPRPRPAQDGVS